MKVFDGVFTTAFKILFAPCKVKVSESPEGKSLPTVYLSSTVTTPFLTGFLGLLSSLRTALDVRG
jgi:hypothetical protein